MCSFTPMMLLLYRSMLFVICRMSCCLHWEWGIVGWIQSCFALRSTVIDTNSHSLNSLRFPIISPLLELWNASSYFEICYFFHCTILTTRARKLKHYVTCTTTLIYLVHDKQAWLSGIKYYVFFKQEKREEINLAVFSQTNISCLLYVNIHRWVTN